MVEGSGGGRFRALLQSVFLLLLSRVTQMRRLFSAVFMLRHSQLNNCSFHRVSTPNCQCGPDGEAVQDGARGVEGEHEGRDEAAEG